MKVKLGDVIDKIVGDEDRFNTTLQYYIGGEHIDSARILITNKGILDSDKGRTLGYQFHYPFEPGDVLFMTKNPYLRKCGYVDFPGICSIATFVLRTKDPNVLCQKYLAVITQTDEFWNYLEANKSGSVNYFITWKTLEKYEFELPDLKRQEQIAEAIWSIEKTRISYEALMDKTEDLVKARFVEMFGEIGMDEKGWGLGKLGQYCVVNPRRPKDVPDDCEVTFIPMPAVSEHGQIDCSETKPYGEVKKSFTYFEEDDVLFAKITPCMENGKGAIARGLSNGIGAGSTEFHVLRPIDGKSNPYWLYVLTMFESFRKLARRMMTGTGGQLRVPANFLEDYMVSLPPFEKQQEFEEFCKNCEESINAIDQTLKDLVALYKKVLSDVVVEEGVM